MEICFPSSPALVFVFGIWTRGMYNTQIIHHMTLNLDLLFSTLFYAVFNLFRAPFILTFPLCPRGFLLSIPPAEVPVPPCPQPHSWQGDAHFPPCFSPLAGRAEPLGHSQCWALSLRGVSEHYASLWSCLLLAGDDLEGRARQRRSRISPPVDRPVCRQMLKQSIHGVHRTKGVWWS